jgi:hypothetical protein
MAGRLKVHILSMRLTAIVLTLMFANAAIDVAFLRFRSRF